MAYRINTLGDVPVNYYNDDDHEVLGTIDGFITEDVADLTLLDLLTLIENNDEAEENTELTTISGNIVAPVVLEIVTDGFDNYTAVVSTAAARAARVATGDDELIVDELPLDEAPNNLVALREHWSAPVMVNYIVN